MIHGVGKLAGDVVQTQVHLVQRQHLLWRLRIRILVHLAARAASSATCLGVSMAMGVPQ